jgi:hypothetical protein
MKKIFLLLSVLSLLLLSACSNDVKTIGDYMREEKGAIETLITKEGFEILNSFPDNGLFDKNQFVLLDNGCYLNIVDSGNGNRAVQGETIVLIRCGLTFMSARGDVPFSTVVDYSKEPVKFIYGDIDNAKVNTTDQNNHPEYTILSAGVESALKYISENAVVRMIIPSNYTDNYGYINHIGSAYQDMNLSPMYYEEIMFEFEFDNDNLN